MTFLIKGGYDILRRHIVNISLRPSNVWMNGLLMLENNRYMNNLYPDSEYKIELVKYNNMNVLLLNNNIIYEDQKIIQYKIELNTIDTIDINDPKLYDFIKYNYVPINHGASSNDQGIGRCHN